MKIDLHIHTKESDGLLTKSELIDLAAQQEVEVISFTDHNCYKDNEELGEVARQKGIRIIDGIEFSAEFNNQEIHVLAYNFDRLGDHLEDFCNKYAELKTDQTKRRCEESIKHPLIAPGGEEISVSFEELCAFKKEGIFFWNEIGYLLADKYNSLNYSPLMKYNDANYLLNGHLDTGQKFQSSFRNLEKGKRLWHSPYDSYYINAEHLIYLIKDARGLSCLAHPGEQRLERETIYELRRFGLDALEVYTPKNTGLFPHYRKIADEFGLYISGGTDFHYFDDKHQLGLILMPEGKEKFNESDFFPITADKITLLERLFCSMGQSSGREKY
ncbi:MAG: PHP domain-containing protein [Candidatus Woesearchaeota archaeon]